MLAFIIAAILSINAEFVQTKQVGLLSEPQISTGRLTYHAPDYIRWEYQTPEQIVWEVNGAKSNVNEQVQRLLRMIMASIANNGEVDAQTQRESKKIFQSIDIIMDEKTQVAKKVEMIEKNGDRTIIEFTNVIVK